MAKTPEDRERDAFDDLRKYEDLICFWEEEHWANEPECEHKNYSTDYEDENVWHGICHDCGAHLEEEIEPESGEQ